MKDEKRSWPWQSSVFYFKPSSGTHVSSPALLAIGDDDLDNLMTVQEEVPPP
jgi:hypothetical protein